MDVAALYHTHALPLMRYLTRLSGDSDIAADALQEAFVRMIERPPRDSNARAWLFTVATNVVREQGRTASRRLSLLDRAPQDALHSDAIPRPDAAVEAAETRNRITRALETLSERDRTVLLMREEGFAHDEIAEAVETTTKSVGTIIARALRKLSERMDLESEDLS